MADVDLDAMTLDELIEAKAAVKAQIDRLHEEVRPVNAAYARKVDELYIEDAVTQVTLAAEREGRTPEEQAQYWLSQDYADPGRHIMARRFLERRVVNVEDVRPQ